MDLYQILQVAEDARREDIRAAYLVLVQESHPDRRHVDSDLAELASESRFKRIQEAFEILHDPARRAEYDRTRIRPVVPGGGVVLTPAGTGRRRDIPMNWLYRTGASGRSKRRLGRWILLALVMAMVVAFLSLRSHFFWRRVSSRATDGPPTLRLAPRASQVAISPANAPAKVRQQADEIDPGDLSPAVDPDQRPDEQDRAQPPIYEFAADRPPVEESLSTSYWDPSLVDSASGPPAMYPPFPGELARFEPVTYDPAVIVKASWQVEDPVSVWTGYPPSIPGAPLPRVTVAPLLINTDSHYLLNAPIADALGGVLVRWQVDDPILEPLLNSPWADEMPNWMLPNPPSLGETAPPNSFAALHLDPVSLGRSVNVPVPSELFPTPNASRISPPALRAKPYRQSRRVTNKWEAPWSVSQNRPVLAPRGNTPLMSRRPASSRNRLDSGNWNSTGAVWPPTLNEIQQLHPPRSVSQMGVTWSTSPPIVDLPATGIRSESVGLGPKNKANQFGSTPRYPVPHVGDSFYQRRETGLHDRP